MPAADVDRQKSPKSAHEHGVRLETGRRLSRTLWKLACEEWHMIRICAVVVALSTRGGTSADRMNRTPVSTEWEDLAWYEQRFIGATLLVLEP
ncbi:hypothetical protein DCS_06388 [Drechmeria coniospora]|uniref:Uncharacterized protein n=1 Tax=Drechmeria coniospora TaxID=98403 RepID=A0A151GBE3_DRECN|nr:hypothetical protein DCS_06388 [Drechmeria coniospora]KYK54430.1 hypothetical protein DCS_06388 [Drechmeria coniospora]